MVFARPSPIEIDDTALQCLPSSNEHANLRRRHQDQYVTLAVSVSVDVCAEVQRCILSELTLIPQRKCNVALS